MRTEARLAKTADNIVSKSLKTIDGIPDVGERGDLDVFDFGFGELGAETSGLAQGLLGIEIEELARPHAKNIAAGVAQANQSSKDTHQLGRDTLVE